MIKKRARVNILESKIVVNVHEYLNFITIIFDFEYNYNLLDNVRLIDQFLENTLSEFAIIFSFLDRGCTCLLYLQWRNYKIR